MRLIYLSPVAWHSFSQRSHELVHYFHEKTGEPVLWVEPYPTRLPVFRDLFRLVQPIDTGNDTPPWLTLIKPMTLPIEPIAGLAWINKLLWRKVIASVREFAKQPALLGIGKPTALGLELLREPIFAASFYDAMDNFAGFYEGCSRAAMRHRQHQTAEAVTHIFTSSSAMHTQLSALSNDVSLLSNACASERLPQRPARRNSRHWRPVFGYVGTIAKWFDWELVIQLAKDFPQAEVRLIGPMHVSTPSALPTNIHIQTTLPHAEAVKAMVQFDVGLIPFKNNEITHFVDPIKYYEYRALGLPVLSTVFGEMAGRENTPGVFLLDKPSDIPTVVEQALSFDESEECTAHFRDTNSWMARFENAHPLTSLGKAS